MTDPAMTDRDHMLLAAMLVSLASDNIPGDTQELLVYGNPERGIRPNALLRALQHQRAMDKDK